MLTDAGVPAGAVNSINQALALAERLGLEPVTAPPDGHGPATVRSPLFLSRQQPSYWLRPPDLDESAGRMDWLA